jgi:hypothetical protein
MLVEHRKRAAQIAPPDVQGELVAWDGYFGNLVAQFKGILSNDPHIVALACASAGVAADAVLAQRRRRTG